MKNIHVLATDKPSRLYLSKEGFYFLLPNIKGNDVKFQHIYITSSEEIKEGDWHFKNDKMVTKSHIIDDTCKKIILTTDQELINDGVQAIQDDFLEWFVNNPKCEQVEVVKEMYMPQSNGKISDGKITHELSLNESLNTLPFYRMIIPKQQRVPVLKLTAFDGTIFTSAATIEAPKQEPNLEEAAKEYDRKSTRWGAKDIFIDGAIWQQQQADTSNPADQLIRGLRVLSQTFTHNELESILEQLYYVKSQEKLEYYFDQIKLNATAADIESAFQYGYFDTLTAMGKN
jgi:hypothetical protein